RFVIDHPLAAGVLARPQLGWPGQPDRQAAPPDPLGGGADDDPDVADRISEPDGDLGDAQSERLNLVRSFAHRTDAHASDVGRTYDQLYNEAKERGLEGRSKVSKAQLERALDR